MCRRAARGVPAQLCLSTSSRDWASAMVTMNSDGPIKAKQRLSLLTVRASGARSVPRATTLPSQSGAE